MSDLTAMFETQNVKDDDGQVIDSFLIETDSPPPLKDATQPIDSIKTETIPDVGRLFTVTQLVMPGWAPWSALVEDFNRKHLYISCFPTALTPALLDQILYADEAGKLSNTSAMGAGIIFTSQVIERTIDDYTGPLYISPGPNLVSPIWVSVTAVTK